MYELLLPPVIVEIKPSKMLKDEVGVFSVRNFDKDKIIFSGDHYAGQMIKWKEFNKFDSITQKKILAYCPGDADGFIAPHDFNYLSIGWHMNHSCNPNVGFNEHDDFIAMRKIKSGEELCWDYGFDEINPKFTMKCSCHDKKCRKLITGNDWKKLVIDKKKYQYFSSKLKGFISSNELK